LAKDSAPETKSGRQGSFLQPLSETVKAHLYYTLGSTQQIKLFLGT